MKLPDFFGRRRRRELEEARRNRRVSERFLLETLSRKATTVEAMQGKYIEYQGNLAAAQISYEQTREACAKAGIADRIGFCVATTKRGEWCPNRTTVGNNTCKSHGGCSPRQISGDAA